MLRRSPLYNLKPTTYKEQSPEVDIQDKQSSYDNSSKDIQLQLEEQMRFCYENNPTRRVHLNDMQGPVNETKVKRPHNITNDKSPYMIGGASYKLERLSPYSSNALSDDNGSQHDHFSNDISAQQHNSQGNKNFTKPTNSQHLVSFGNITYRNPSTHSSKKSNPYLCQNQKIVDKENYQPNSEDSQHSHPSSSKSYNMMNKSVGGRNTTTPSIKQPYSSKPNTQHQNDFLLPIVNTNSGNNSHHSNHSEINNFHSNNLSEESSISPGCDSRISQADESAYLKQKLLQTHSKLIKELEISKQLEDNFFELKKKYQDAISILNKEKSSKENQEKIQNQLKQFKQKQAQFNAQKVILTQKISELTQQNKHLSVEISEMSQKMTEIILQNQKQASLKYSSNDMKQYVNQGKAPLQEELIKQTQKNAQFKNDLENMRNKILQLIKEKQSKDEELASMTEEKQFVSGEYKLLEEKLSKKEKQFSEKQELCEIWRKKYSDAQEQYEKVYESSIKHEKQSKELKNLSNELNIALRQEKQKNAQMLSQIINIQMETKQLKSKVGTLEEEKKNLQDKLFENTQQKNLLQQKLELEHSIQKLTHQYNSLSAIINKKDKQISELTNEVMEKNNMVQKMMVREKQLEMKEREIQKREREINDQKVSRITSVREFVNKLEQEKQRSVGLKRVNHNSQQSSGAYCNQLQNQQMVRQNFLNQSSSMRLSSGNTTPTRQLSPISNNNKTPKCQFPNKNPQLEGNTLVRTISAKTIQNPSSQQRSLTPSKSLSGLRVNNLPHHNQYEGHNQKILICQNGENEVQEDYQEKYDNYEEERQEGYVDNQDFPQQYESVEDSLQLVRMINTVNSNKNKPSKNENHMVQSVNTNPSVSKSTQLQNKRPSSQHTPGKSLPHQKQIPSYQTEEKQRQISSYKQQKQQYLSLLQEIGELETQNYNLNQEKKKIVEELDRIQSTKTKTKEIIARRRQLQLWLLGNEKKNNQVKEKLKNYRGKVL